MRLSFRAAGDVDALGAFLEENGMTVLDPPGEYYGRNYYAVYFADPDGMKLEGMIWAPPEPKRKPPYKAGKRAPRNAAEDHCGVAFERNRPSWPTLSSTGACATTVLRPRRFAS